MTTDCIFCQIIAGDAEASLVAEDEHAIAFMDIRPINAGHLLVVPKRHAEQIGDMHADDLANTMRLLHRVASALPDSGIRHEAYNVWQANGEAASQDVFHVHFHIIPRYRGDALDVKIAHGREQPPRKELDRMAAQLRNALES